jgi:hypothetical protein
MNLRSTPNFPSTRCYVLKLHRDATPADGRLQGRLEHIASGEHVDFTSGDDLLNWVARHAAALDAGSPEGTAP